MTNPFEDLEPQVGEISALTVGGTTTAPHEDALIGGDDDEVPVGEQTLITDDSATTYFNSVGEEEALNYIMFLHDMNVISFDRLIELKTLLEKTSSFLPEGF
jgi:hypothetical protein